MAAQTLLITVGMMVTTSVINSFGSGTVAAYTVGNKVEQLATVLFSQVAFSFSVFAGQNFGARRYDRMRRSVRVCLGMAAGVTVFMTALILAVGRPMLGMFTDDAHVVEMGMSIIRLIVPTWITYLCIEILSGAMRGAGDSLMPTLMTLTGVCLMRVFWVTVVVPRMHQLPVLMLSYPITWVITSCMFIVYYLRGRWLDRCIARQGSVQKP